MKRLEIQNFRNISFKLWEPKNKMDFLIGGNAIGKTSFLKAIRFALTGEIDKADIKDGEDATRVEVTLGDGTVFSREVSRTKATKIKVDGKTTTAKSLVEVLERYFGVSFEDIQCIASSDIGMLPSSDLAKLILKYAKMTLTKSDIEGYLDDLTAKQAKQLLDYFPAGSFELSEIDNAYDKACEDRKTAKILYKEKVAQSKYDGPAPETTLADVDARYKKILTAEAEVKANADLLLAYNNAISKKEEIDRSIADLEKQISDLKDVEKPMPAKFEALNKKEDDLLKEKVDVEVLMRTINNNIEMFETTLDNLESSICPLCESLECTTDKTCVREELQEALKSNKEGLANQEKKLVKMNSEIEKIREDKNLFRKQENDYNKKTNLMNKLVVLKKSYPEIPKKPIASVKKDFSAEKSALDKERREIQRYLDSEKAMIKLEKMADEIEDLEVVVKQLSSKGDVRYNVTEFLTGILSDEMNKVAEKMRTEYHFDFKAENGITIYFKTKDISEPRKYEYLSNSEKVICNFFLLHYINNISGFKLLVLDDINHLDKSSTEDLMKLVMSPDIQSKYNNIVFASVSNPDIEDVLSGYSIERI